MTTNKIVISNSGDNMEDAFAEVEKYADYQKVSHKTALHLRLLTEEAFGMLREMVGSFTTYFYVDGDGRTNTLNIEGNADMDVWERSDLLSVSKSGKNVLATGIMGKIRAVIEAGALGLEAGNGCEPLDYGYILSTAPMDATTMSSTQFWSLSAYRDEIAKIKDEGEIPAKAWDELEKSIVANLADDVQVGILKGKIKLIITYKSKE